VKSVSFTFAETLEVGPDFDGQPDNPEPRYEYLPADTSIREELPNKEKTRWPFASRIFIIFYSVKFPVET